MRKKKPPFSIDIDDLMKLHILALILTALWVIWTVKKSVDNDDKTSKSTQLDQRPETEKLGMKHLL